MPRQQQDLVERAKKLLVARGLIKTVVPKDLVEASASLGKPLSDALDLLIRSTLGKEGAQ